MQVARDEPAVVDLAEQPAGRVALLLAARQRQRDGVDAAGDDEAAQRVAFPRRAERERLDRRESSVARGQEVLGFALALGQPPQGIARLRRDGVGAEHLDVDGDSAEGAAEHPADGSALALLEALLRPLGDVALEQRRERVGQRGSGGQLRAAGDGRGLRQC